VVKIHEDKMNYWIEQGARVSEAVKAILKNEKRCNPIQRQTNDVSL